MGKKKGLSRRDFLKVTGTAGAGALLGAKTFGVPAYVRQVGDFDLAIRRKSARRSRRRAVMSR
jgi:hypothetical protein